MLKLTRRQEHLTSFDSDGFTLGSTGGISNFNK
jgi:hypothetical protein